MLLRKLRNWTALTLANVEALEQNESDGVQAVWNRNTFTCTIYGNGKIKIAGGSIVEVKGSLTFDGGLYCTTDGNATCSPVECNDLWQQIF
ncbi:hypothetical protein CGC52_10995 [Capnocytophaga sp. H2931]|nr:hypothetical protein CGC52_10995 [Capnocytophaga sp. H2931]